MKKTIISAVALCMFGMLAVSCGSTKNVQSPADVYEDEKVEAITTEDGEAIKDSEKKDKKAKDPKKKNFVQEIFTFGNRDEYSKYYEISLYEKEITGLKEKRATTVIRTDNYMAGFGSYYNMAYYYVQFDEVARTKFIQAIDAYLADFENKNLQRKGKHTDRAYGKVAYRLDWGSVSSSTPNMGTGEGYMGYVFKKGSPYFVLSNYAFENLNYDKIGSTTSRESLPLDYYFTRSQLIAFKEFISNDNITQLVNEMNENYISGSPDEY